MFEPSIESNIICPKCGWKWIFNDMAYVNHSSEWGMQMSCPKCKNKFRVRKEDTKYTHKPSNSNIVIKEVEETKKKILSLMERVNKDGFRMCKNDDFDTTEENVSEWPCQIPSLLDYGTISCIKRIKNKDTTEIVALFRREDNANYFWAKTFESEKDWEVIREIPEWAHQYILPYDPNEGWIAVKTF